MSDNLDKNLSGLQKFSKLNCLWNPQESSNPKFYDSYAYLDLHLNQFLSNITEDYTFLPNSIYKPSIHVFIDNKLVYKTKILDYNNDLFDESIRLKVYSTKTLVTLKLFENEQFNTTKSEQLELKPTFVNLKTNLYLVSWVDLDIGLMVPEKNYKVVCTFKSNPSFYSYNPGGLLYYPTKDNKPSIHYKRVCSSCKVCSLLSFLSVGKDKNYDSINKYFDYKFLKDKLRPSDSNSPSKKHTILGDDKDEEELDLVEVIDMTSNSKRSRKDSCNCLQLRTIPLTFKNNKNEVCLKCHDYEVCCDHSLNNYYLSVNFKLVPSSEKIDFSTELFSCLLSPPKFFHSYEDLASIFELLYQNFYSFESILNHLQCSKERALLVLKVSLMFFILGSVFNRFYTFLFFLLSAFFFLVGLTSSTQFRKDNGDVLYVTRNLYFFDQGLDRFLMKYIELENKEKPLIVNGKPYPVDKKAIERNNYNIPEHNIVDKTKVYTKAHTSYRRCENIALKTICYGISESIPTVLKSTLMKLVELVDNFVRFTNGLLALVRLYGLYLSFGCLFMGLLSLKFYNFYRFLFKALSLMVLILMFGRKHKFVKYVSDFLWNLFQYLVIRVYRKEWFLNT